MKRSLVLFVLFLFTVFIIFFIPQIDVDFGWHYKCGQLLLAGNPCINNTFTYYLSNYKWAYPSFLFDGLLYLTYNLGGFVATSFVYSVLMSVFAFLLYKASKLNKTLFIVLFFTSVYFSFNVLGFGLRAQVFTLVFFVLFLILLKNLNYSNLFLVPLLFLIWVNTHAGFFLGPLFLIFYIFSEILLLLFKFISKPEFDVVFYYKHRTFKGLVALILICIISILATFINPFYTQVYAEVVRHSQTPLNMLIAEWTSPKTLTIVTMFFMYIVFLFLQFFNKKLTLFSSFVLGVTLYLAITANRNVPLFFFSYLVFLSDFKIMSNRVHNFLCIYGEKLLIYLFVIFLIFFAPLLVINTVKNSSFNAYCNAYSIKYPCEAIKILKDKNVRIYNRYEWGGFLIWQLPKAKIYIDGRMPAWIDDKTGLSPYQVWLDIYQTKQDWNNKLDDLNTQYLLISPHTFIDLELSANSGKYMYKEIYRDSVSVVYQRE